MRVTGFCGSVLMWSCFGAAAYGQTPYPAVNSPPMSHYGAPAAIVQPLSDADLLTSELRLLAVDPQNLQALIRAGELALKLDDDTAAAAFFARASQIDWRNARVKAGEGSLLVAAERPGDALRHFAEAVSLGADPRSFAADRGLAYDLIGEPERAQRDYRLALKAGPNDETQRRYALSLGISGKRDLALAQIDPLLRRNDRGAWRTRAFILAMAGDKVGAEKIATTMMPAGTAQGLLAFFELLPTLRPVDRAFAVHFGEVRASSARTADARLVPPLAALGPDPTLPVAVAAVAKPVVVVDAREERRRAKAARKTRGRTAVAVVTVAPVPPPPPLPLPAPPGPVAAPVVLASNSVRVAPVIAPTPITRVPIVVMSQPRAPIRLQSATVPAPFVALPRAVPVPRVVPAVTALAATPPPSPAPTPVRSEDSILAAIIADIKVPGTEATTLPPPVTPRTAPLLTQRIAKPVVAKPVIDETARSTQGALAKKASEKKVAADIKAIADARTLAETKKRADAKKLADSKKLADGKKLADAKKLADDKKKKDPKVLEPARIWVQVSGGANEQDLPKAWAQVRAKSKAFGSKSGWTTPLRATNRILTGPFKTEGEAQAFVNSVAKGGVSGFVFVSDAGQKISKLAGK